MTKYAVLSEQQRLLHTASAHSSAAFVMVKGYHMGSKWFAEEFSRVPGCALFFEYEHCLHKLSPQRVTAVAASSSMRPLRLAPVNLTAQYLRRGCHCKTQMERLQQCVGCDSPPAQRPGECRAAGISIGALSAQHMEHLRQLRLLLPHLKVLTMVRSNLVKHALSFTRTDCGSRNHAYNNKSVEQPPRLRVPPAQLHARVVIVAQGQQRVVDAARALPGGDVAYQLVYEAMQRDLQGQIQAVLRAVGAPPLPAGWEQDNGKMEVKAGTEAAAELLENFDETERYFRPMRCLHDMLMAEGPVIFPVQECPAAMPRSQMGSTERKRPLSPSECGSLGTTSVRGKASQLVLPALPRT